MCLPVSSWSRGHLTLYLGYGREGLVWGYGPAVSPHVSSWSKEHLRLCSWGRGLKVWFRVCLFRLKKFFAYKRNKAIGSVSQVFHYFTIKFHFSFLTFFAFFCFFLLFLLFSLFFALNFLLRFDLVIFTSKRNEGENFFASKEAKFNIFRIISLPNFVLGEKKKKQFYRFFSLNFRFASIFSLNFCLFYFRFCFRFLVFRIEVNHVKSGFFFVPRETKFSLQFQISLPKPKWGRTLVWFEGVALLGVLLSPPGPGDTWLCTWGMGRKVWFEGVVLLGVLLSPPGPGDTWLCTWGMGRKVWFEGVVLLGVLLSPPGPGDIRLGPAQKSIPEYYFLFMRRKIPGTVPYTSSFVLTESWGEEHLPWSGHPSSSLHPLSIPDTGWISAQSTYIYIYIENPRRKWDSPNPSPASECALPPPPGPKGGGYTRVQWFSQLDEIHQQKDAK